MLSTTVEYDSCIEGSRKLKWRNLIALMGKAGRIGSILCSQIQSSNRRGNVKPAIRLALVDLDVYEELFDDEAKFGKLSSYTYATAEPRDDDNEVSADDEHARTIDHGRIYRKMFALTDVQNMDALKARIDAGPAQSGERRQEGLESFYADMMSRGYPVGIANPPLSGNGLLHQVGASVFWARERGYVKLEGFGRALQVGGGTQCITKEARATGYSGLPIGEMDLVSAFYQMVVLSVRALPESFNAADSIKTVSLYVDHPKDWRVTVAQYFGITVDQAKRIFCRLPMGGGALDLMRPGEASGPVMSCHACAS